MLAILLGAIYIIGVAIWLGILFFAAVKTPGHNGSGVAIAIIVLAWVWPITWIAIAVYGLLPRVDTEGKDAA